MNSSLWTTFAVAALPAGAAIGAALLASRSAREARRLQTDADHLQRLEDRLASRKQKVYEPIIELLGNMLGGGSAGPEAETTNRLNGFSRWVAVVGSDEAVRSFHNIMQASYNDAPPALFLRLYADFQLAARRDMGDPKTELSRLEVMGMRIRDLYSDDDEIDLYGALTKPFDELSRELGWSVPWDPRPSEAQHQ